MVLMIKVGVDINNELSSDRVGMCILLAGDPLGEEIVQNTHVEMQGCIFVGEESQILDAEPCSPSIKFKEFVVEELDSKVLSRELP